MRDLRHVAINELDYLRNAVVVICGVPGAGKTTLLRRNSIVGSKLLVLADVVRPQIGHKRGVHAGPRRAVVRERVVGGGRGHNFTW